MKKRKLLWFANTIPNMVMKMRDSTTDLNEVRKCMKSRGGVMHKSCILRGRKTMKILKEFNDNDYAKLSEDDKLYIV